MFTGFFCLFGSIVLLPLYLQDLMGYTAFWAGLVLGAGGIAAFLIMPLAGLMMKKNVSPLVRQAHMMAFNDTFWLLAWATSALIPLTIFFRQQSKTELREGLL